MPIWRPAFRSIFSFAMLLLIMWPLLPHAAFAQGTPTTVSPPTLSGAPGSLKAMLHAVPGFQPQHPRRGWTLSYANFAAEAEAAGRSIPTSSDALESEQWFEETRYMARPSIADYLSFPEWSETFGFPYIQIDQAIEFRGSGDYWTFLHGQFNREDLHNAWRDSGYQELPIGDKVVWYFHGDDYIDFNSPVTQFAVGALNYSAILPDGTLVFANRLSGMASIIGSALGISPSMADESDVRALLTGARENQTSVRLFDGSVWTGTACCNPNVPPEAFQQERTEIDKLAATYGPMPPFSIGFLGESPLAESSSNGPITTGTPESATDPRRTTLEIALVFESVQDATTASSIVPGRIAVMWSASARVPYTELYRCCSIRVLPDLPVLVVDLDARKGQLGLLENSFHSTDLRFLISDPSHNSG